MTFTLSPFHPFTLAQLRQCAEREAKIRRRIYPNRVNAGRMTKQAADREIAMMDQIAAHLAQLEQAELLL